MSCCKTITKAKSFQSGLQLRNLGLSAALAGGPGAGGDRCWVCSVQTIPAGMGHHLEGAAGVCCGGIHPR